MKFYAVRLAENKEAVGFVCAKNDADLFSLVDEIIDPNLCEYKTIEFGGGMFFSKKAKTFPIDLADEDSVMGNLDLLSENIINDCSGNDGRGKTPLSWLKRYI